MADQVALVTGASRGIGQACARVLARSGVRLALVARGAEELAAEVSHLTREGVRAVALPGDVAQE